jgi:8-oxo-dGTP diphosphatase
MILAPRLRQSWPHRCSLRSATSGGSCCWSAGVTAAPGNLPGGRVDVGESAVEAAVRETSEESGLRVRITGLVGLFTDPACVVESAAGDEVRQQFVVCFHGRAMWGKPHPDLQETSDAAWFDPADVAALPVQPAAGLLIVYALSGADGPHLG